MDLTTMERMLEDAGIPKTDLDVNFGTAWNFAAQYLQCPKLVKLVAKLPKEEVLELAELLNTGERYND